MKVIIAGSRTITKLDHIYNAVKASGFKISVVVSGGARGVDLLGERWAEREFVPVKMFPAQWNRYGKSAGYRRNEQMAEYADTLIAVWDGKSRGTEHMIDLMTKLNHPVFVHIVPDV